MKTDYDVVVIGGGPAGLYAGLVLKKGLPTQRVSEELKVAIFEKGKIGGLAKYGYITFSERWAFSGSKIISTFYNECLNAGVIIEDGCNVFKISNNKESDIVTVQTNIGSFTTKFVIITSGIFPNPDAMAHRNVLLALHTPDKMLNDIYRKQWKNIILYGADIMALDSLKEKLNELDPTLTFHVKLQEGSSGEGQLLPGISDDLFENYDGVLVDYNSYKVRAGSLDLIEIPEEIKVENGYILTNHFGRTDCQNIYAAGNVANVISGVLIALSSALTASLTVGRMLTSGVISEPTGRFPWYPREFSWENSWLPYLEGLGELDSYNQNGKYVVKK